MSSWAQLPSWPWVGFRCAYLDIDAFPDTTPVQVQINTVAPALGPEEVEQRITFPIEQAIGGPAWLWKTCVPSRSSGFRRSWSRSRMARTFTSPDNSSTNDWRTVELAAGIGRPKMGPVATGLG